MPSACVCCAQVSPLVYPVSGFINSEGIWSQLQFSKGVKDTLHTILSIKHGKKQKKEKQAPSGYTDQGQQNACEDRKLSLPRLAGNEVPERADGLGSGRREDRQEKD